MNKTIRKVTLRET